MITPGDVDDAAESFEDLIDSIGTTCTVARPPSTTTTDSLGTPTNTFATVAEQVPCLVNDTARLGSAGFTRTQDRPRAEQSVEILFYLDANIQSGDRLILAGPRTYEVRDLLDDESMRMVLRAQCIRDDRLG